jgi:two-component system response regulator PilR (NtrC family)
MKSAILFISPSADDARAVSEMLSRVEIPMRHAPDLSRARQMLAVENFGAVLTESRLPDGSWEDVVRLVERTRRRLAVVVTDRFADARFWADVLEFGAYDLLPKPFSSGEVQRILANAVHEPPRLSRAAPAA